MGLLDNILGSTGQQRRAWLDQLGRDASYYVPPELRGLLGFAAEMTPTATIDRAAQAGARMMAPNRSPMQRIGDLGGLLSETAGVVAPAMVANRAAMPAAQALQESLLGFSMGADDAARRFVADESGNIKLWHGSPYDFDKFDLQKIGTGEGAQDLGRGFSLTDYEANAHMYTNPASRWGDLAAMEKYSKAGPGRYYQVDVDADPSQFLDWNKPWRDQVNEGTPLFDALKRREDSYLKNYDDDPDMVAAIPQANLSTMWKDGAGMEDAAMQSGFVGNKRGNYSGDTEYTVFDPSKMNIVKKFDKDGNALPISQQPKGITAYHGSPHDFDRFSMDAIGTGEGAQAYGHGLYFAQNENVARGYRDALSDRSATLGKFVKSSGEDVDILDAPDGFYSLLGEQPDNTSYDQLLKAAQEKLEWAQTRKGGLRDELTRKAQTVLDFVKENKGVRFERNPDRGRMYEVNINADPDDFLDWDKPLSEQPEALKKVLREADLTYLPEGSRLRRTIEAHRKNQGDWVPDEGVSIPEPTGSQIHSALTDFGTDTARNAEMTRKLAEQGIPGIKYLDAGSRGAGDGSRNFVVFDENLIQIVRKYGIAGAAAMLGVSASDIQSAIGGQSGLLSDQEQNKQDIRNYLGLL